MTLKARRLLMESTRVYGIASALSAIVGTARVHAANIEIVPRASLREQYNDNIFFNDEEKEDFVTSIGIGLALRFNQPRLAASLSAATSAQVFARASRENNLFSSQTGNLLVAYRATPRLTMLVSDSVVRVDRTRTGVQSADAPPSPDTPRPGPDDDASTVLPRGEALSNYLSARAEYALAPQWTTGIAYRNSLGSFSDPGARDLTQQATLEAGHAWSPKLSFSGSYAYTNFDFSGQDATDTETHSTNLGAQWRPVSNWSAELFAGVFVNRPLESSSDSASTRVGPLFRAEVARFGERSEVALGLSQQVTASAGVNGASTTRNYFLRGAATLFRDVNGTLGFSYSDFDTSQNTFGVIQLSASVSMPLSTYLTAGLGYHYLRRDSDHSTNDFNAGVVDGNSVSIFVRGHFPLWQGSL